MTQAHSTTTPADGLEGELLHLGSGGEADYAGKDARGKIVVTELSYAPPRPEKTRLATEHGALAFSLSTGGGDDNPSMPMGTVKPAWGNPTMDDLHKMPTLPAVGIARRDGTRVLQLCQAGDAVRARIIATGGREWRSINQPDGILGAGSTGDWILVGGHMDSWGGGAADNASGNAVPLEVARVLAGHRSELCRDIQIGFWQAHEDGIMEGSTWFVDYHWDKITRGLGYINIDSPGMKHAERYEATLSPELWTWHRDVIRNVLGYVTEPQKLAKTGGQSFFGVGVPAIWGHSGFPPALLERWHGAVLGPWYQSTDDTTEVADRRVLAHDLRMSVACAWELSIRPVLPYDFRDPARLLREAIDGYRHATDDTLGLDETASLAREFEIVAGRLFARQRRGGRSRGARPCN
ncbi:MAG TPA: M28 family peptidase [bacterium]|nr:M28 family peptidase [bacterium]